MKLKTQIIALPVVLLVLVSLSAIPTRTWTPGVQSGDYFTYEMYGVYTSNRPNTTIAIPQFEQNTTDWTRINITRVSNSTIYQIYTLHYKNGDEKYFSLETDVNPQNQNTFNISQGVPVCATNLKPGDRIPTAQIILNDTVTRIYADNIRETNHAQWNITAEWGDIYFDKQTGMLVELQRTRRFVNSITGMVVEKTDVIRLISTNRWQIES